MPASPEYDLFISYKSVDKEFALKLAEAIEVEFYQGRNLRVFIDEWEIRAGENIVRRIDSALEKSRFIALVLSPEYLGADWPTAERDAAIWRDPSGRLGHAIPIMHRKCSVPPLLTYRKYIDFVNMPFKTALAQILAILRDEPLPRGRRGPDKPLIGATLPSSFSDRHLHGALPDDVQEEIYPNLFSVTSLPPHVYHAPTPFRTRKEVYEYFGRRPTPAFLLRKERLYTFVDLTKRDHAFVNVVDEYDVRTDDVEDWLNDADHGRWLVDLLQDAVRSHTMTFGMSHDKTSGRLYYRDGVLQKQLFKASGKGRGRELIKDYTKASEGSGFKAHRAVTLKFEIMGVDVFLKVETGWIFTTDGYTPIEGQRRKTLNTKFQTMQKNQSNLSEVRFWMWFLSEDGTRILLPTGGEFIEIDLNPIAITVQGGVFGDFTPLSKMVEPPPLEFEPESEDAEEGREPREQLVEVEPRGE